MKPRITVFTVGVDDLERSLRFYRDGLGFKTDGIIGEEFEHGAAVFFDLENGSRFAIWPRESIAHDTGLPVTVASPTDFTLGHNVGSVEEVDAIMARAEKAGATIVKPAAKTFLGRLCGLLPGSRRASLGSVVESGVPAGVSGLVPRGDSRHTLRPAQAARHRPG